MNSMSSELIGPKICEARPEICGVGPYLCATVAPTYAKSGP